MWSPTVGGDSPQLSELWVKIADINQRLTRLVAEVHDLSAMVYEEHRKAEEARSKP